MLSSTYSCFPIQNLEDVEKETGFLKKNPGALVIMCILFKVLSYCHIHIIIINAYKVFLKSLHLSLHPLNGENKIFSL